MVFERERVGEKFRRLRRGCSDYEAGEENNMDHFDFRSPEMRKEADLVRNGLFARFKPSLDVRPAATRCDGGTVSADCASRR
jgi:hypothetical protein